MESLRKKNVSPIRVALLDSGVDLNHSFFKDYATSLRKHARGFPPELDPCEDRKGSGTYSASVILKTSPDVTLYIARVIGSSNTTGISTVI